LGRNINVGFGASISDVRMAATGLLKSVTFLRRCQSKNDGWEWN